VEMTFSIDATRAIRPREKHHIRVAIAPGDHSDIQGKTNSRIGTQEIGERASNAIRGFLW
jgi:hypothetical protein